MSKQAAALIVVIFTAQAVHSLQLIPGRPFYYCCGRVGNTGWYLFLLFSHWAVNVFYFYCSSLPCVCNKADAGIGAVLHTHSPVAVVLSQIWPQEQLSISGWELQKAFAGETTHEATLNFPLFANDQDIARLAAQVETTMQQQGQGHAYLIRGHGVYTWGKDLTECFRHLEALENLLGYQLELLKLRPL